jgi:chloramphenicol-sensitive protein RarD
MQRPPASAVLSAVTAFSLWGFLPVYWKQISHLGADISIAQRVVWTLMTCLLLLLGRRETVAWWRELRRPEVLRTHALSALLLGINWGVFIWGALHGRILECSLGYFLNPLLNVLIGCMLLGESLNGWQKTSITLAAVGVGLQMLAVGRPPWIALLLALSFGFYGLVRRRSSQGPLTGLATESLIAMPVALGLLSFWHGSGRAVFGDGSWHDLVYILGLGAVTTVPLLGFANGARKLPFSLLGLLQFLAPTGQFLVGAFIYDEPLPPASLAAFAFIWSAVAVFCLELWLRSSRRSPA